MSSEFYPNSISRNLLRISGTGYSENSERSVRPQIQGAGAVAGVVRRILRDYIAHPLLSDGRSLSGAMHPLHVRWMST